MASSSRACPPQAESWCSRLVRRPNVSLIWQATQIVEPARPLDRNCEDCRCPDRTANTGSTSRARRTKHDGVLAQLKAKPLRGGPKGPALTCSARAILHSPRSGRRGGRSRTKRWLLILDTHIPHVSNPDCLRGRILDCFASLAMTEQGPRRVGKGALFARRAHQLATCENWWARFALPTLRSRDDGKTTPRPRPACSHTARRSTGSPP